MMDDRRIVQNGLPDSSAGLQVYTLIVYFVFFRLINIRTRRQTDRQVLTGYIRLAQR